MLSIGGEIIDFWRSQSGSDLNDRGEGDIETISPTSDRSKMGSYDGRTKLRISPLAVYIVRTFIAFSIIMLNVILSVMLKIYPDDLDEILALAEDAEGPPPEPEGGIPRQWLPGWVRWPVRVILLPFILLDLAAQKIARLLITPPFKKEGKCLKRGNCCHYILVPEAKGFLGRLFYFWNTQFLGFYQRMPEAHESDGKRVYVMGCRYLKKNGECGHYYLRPAVCRKWPIIEYFGHPRIIKGCGFKAVSRK